MLTIQFLFVNAGACLAIFLGSLHYQDMTRFCRCISGTGDVYFTLASILLRNFVILHILGKTFILKIVMLQEQVTYLRNPSFFSILYQVILAELFLMDVVLIFKIIVSRFFYI